MNNKIVPTLFSRTSEGLFSQYNMLSSRFSYFHIDFASSDFVDFDFYDETILQELQKNNHFCEVHLMCQDVVSYIKKLSTFSCVKSVIIHFEIFKCEEEIELFSKSIIKQYPSLSFQLALSPQSKIEDVFKHLSIWDRIMVMGVVPGKQGQTLIPLQIKKAQVIARMGVQVSLDGGVNLDTLKTLFSANEISQLNIGSFLNSVQSALELEERYSYIESLLSKNKELEEISINENPLIVIADVGGTYTKVYRGLLNEFSVDSIEYKKTLSFTSFDDMLHFICGSLVPNYLVIGVAGANYNGEVTMTHNDFVFNKDKIQKKYQDTRIDLYNDCELAGHGIYSHKYCEKIQNSEQNVSSFNFLEVLVMMGTGLGVSHISNSGIVYSSQGGHLYPRIDDFKYLHYLQEHLNTNEITFDDILSANGLETRFFYDTGIFKSSNEIIGLAKQNDEIVFDTMRFFLQELLYFLNDCIYFDNIIHQLYLAGEFLVDSYSLIKKYYPKKYRELNLNCEITLILKNHLQFLGGLEVIRKNIS